MARQENGYMGGFSGRLGAAVGYQWRGRWYLRARPQTMSNPRTAKQMAHRGMFKQEVQLASYMHWAVKTGLDTVARGEGMTADNLFVSINQGAFGLEEERLTVDYPALQLSLGPVAPVGVGEASLSGDNVLTVSFTKGPAEMPSRGFDSVFVFAYSPELQMGYLASPVYRRMKRVSVCLPERFAGHALQLYAFVKDDAGRCSPTTYLGAVDPEAEASDLPETVLPTAEAEVQQADPQTVAIAEAPVATAPADGTGSGGPAADPRQLSLW